MSKLRWLDDAIAIAPGQTALDALLEAGVRVAHSCKAGACQSCLVRGQQGQIPAEAQKGLSAALTEQQYLLACMCKEEALGEGGLQLAPLGDALRSMARVVGVTWLSESVVRVLLHSTSPHTHRAGQYLTLVREDGLARSYSIASLPGEAWIELHVRVLADGRMSQWLASGAAGGSSVELIGPAGHCFYTSDAQEKPLLLAGTGTGLAPLYGILQDALRQGHRGPIWLYHGARDAKGLYLEAELEELAAEHPELRYVRSLLEADGPLENRIAAEHPKLAGYRAYVCGNASVVSKLKRKLFLGGVASRDLFSDPFVPASV